MSLFKGIGSTLTSSLRVLDTARVFTTNGAGFIFDSFSGSSPKAAEALRKSFEQLGATYIKLGQLIASAPGLFPKEFVEEMQKCLDSVAPIPYNQIEKILNEEFSGRHKEIFSSINPEPMASASIAQVHAATLKDGADVVIKIQRPGIERILDADMNLIYLAALIFEKIAPGGARAGLTGIVQEFQKTIIEEVDFIKEAANIEEFKAFLDDVEEAEVVVPKVYHHATTKRVLTMQRFYGVSLTDLEAIKKISDDPRETLVTALNTWFQSLVYCGFFHADVHAGNLMVLEDGRIGFIDFGIVGRMDENIWASLMGLVQGLGTEDYRLIAQSMVGINATDADVDIDKFAKEIEQVFSGFYEIGNKVMTPEDINNIDEEQINRLMMNLVNVAEANGLKIPREFALLFKQMLYFDRYIQLLAPDLNLATSSEIQWQPKTLPGN